MSKYYELITPKPIMYKDIDRPGIFKRMWGWLPLTKRVPCSKYKYELLEEYRILLLGIFTTMEKDHHSSHISWLNHLDGLEMVFKAGYQWDGCSGPTWDTGDGHWFGSTMRGGLVHDGGFQGCRERTIPHKYVRAINRVFGEVLNDDGCCKVRAGYYRAGVSTPFATRYAKPWRKV